MKFDVRESRAEVLTWLDQLHRKQIPFATKNAINACAKKAAAEVVAQMRSRFDRPTPITLRSVRVKKFASKTDLTAEVWLKDVPLGRSKTGGYNPLSMADMIGHQFGGGGRVHKNYERVLISKGFMDRNEFTVPGIAARMDSYGNISNGMIVQILSQIGIKRSGSDSTPTGSKRSKRNVLKAGEMFWSNGIGSFPSRAFTGSLEKIDWETGRYRGKKQWLPKGVWMRIPEIGKAVPVLLVVKKTPSYKRRIALEEVADMVMARDFGREMRRAMDDAIRTAR